MALSETWLHDAAGVAAGCATPEGYSIFRSDRTNGHGGGVACIIKNSLAAHQLCSVQQESFDHLLIKIQIDANTSLTCLIIYRPPPDAPAFCEQLTSLLTVHLKPNSKVMICGDLNYWAGNSSDKEGIHVLSTLEALGFVQHISCPTHELGNTLDWLLTYNIVPRDIRVFPCPWSDHFFICHALAVDQLQAKPVYKRLIKTCRNISKISIPHFMACVEPLLIDLLVSDNADCIALGIKNILNNTTDLLAPEKMKMVKTEVKSKTWFSDEILKARSIKRKAEAAWRRLPNEHSRDSYKLAARGYKEAIYKAKSEWYNDRIEAAKSSSRELFKAVKELEGIPTSKDLPTPSKDWCNNIQTSMFSKIEKHIASIEAKISTLSNLDDLNLASVQSEQLNLTPSFAFRPVTTEEISKIIGRMKPTPYKGDLVTADLMKRAISVLAPALAKLVNISFATASVPLCLKEAWISPLLKKPSLDPGDPLNYRPITHVSFLLKILDAVAHLQIREFLETNNLLNARQSGFRKGFGTETALLDLKNNLSEIIDKGKPAILLLLDLSAAFDLVDHALLVRRLKDCFNFSPLATDWLDSFLSGRTARVFVGEETADPTPLLRGVPQGSCLSPTLYNLYTRPLFDLLACHGVGFTNYADDTQIFLPLSGCYKTDLTKIQSVYNLIQNWMARNRLALNDAKTEILLLGTRAKLAKLSTDYAKFDIGGCVIQTASVVKTLGVYLDANLSMGNHVAKLKSSCAYILKLIQQIKNFLSKKNLARVAGAFINARLDYCNSLFAGADKKVIQSMQTIQNNAVRTVSGLSRREHVSSARRDLHWLPVQHRIAHKICSLAHRCIHDTAPSYLSDCVSLYAPARSLRSDGNLSLKSPKFKLATFGGRMFAVQAAGSWNKLPILLKQIPEIDAFKKSLKTFLFDNVT